MSPFRLDNNLALFAGAGSGKTYSLMTLALHVLAGARARPPLPPAKLCLVTFTEKAAAQLASRLRERVDRLCRGVDLARLEPELAASFEALGRVPPDAAFWHDVRDELVKAQIGTFHGLALRWLRRHRPASAARELLDEDDAELLLRECTERLVLERLSEGDPNVQALCGQLQYRGTAWSVGLVDALVEGLQTLRNEGISAGDVLGLASDEGLGLDAVASGLNEVRREADTVLQTAEAAQAVQLAPLRRLVAALANATPERLDEAWPAFQAALVELPGNRGKGGVRDGIRAIRARLLGDSDEGQCGLGGVWAGVRARPLEQAVGELWAVLEQRYRQALRDREAWDFGELLVELRDELRGDVAFRHSVQQRIGALLVDEFQDTNRVQLDIVTLLSEQRSDAPRELSPSSQTLGALPLEASFLAIVGDRKQSIYEFRGADVSLFSQLTTSVVSQGGFRHALSQNFRARPRLWGHVQGASAEILKPADAPARAYEFEFSPDDALEAVRPPHDAPPLTVLATEPTSGGVAGSPDRAFRTTFGSTSPKTFERRSAEADALARHLRRLLAAQQSPTWQEADGVQRVLRGGDIAVLFRVLTHVEIYARALLEAGIPHRVIRGTATGASPEARDVLSLLEVLEQPDATLPFVALLRSPWVGLSDAGLFHLACAANGRLRPAQVRERSWGSGLSADDARRLARFLDVEAELRRAQHALSLHMLLESAVAELGFREALAASPRAHSRLRNLDALLVRAARRDAQGRGQLALFADELRALASGGSREFEPPGEDEPDCVQLLTVHQAKGLEWPVVVLADAGNAGGQAVSQRLLLERTLGVALRPTLVSDGEAVDTPRWLALRAERERRERAEHQRLFYVALTRARERLIVFEGGSPRGKGSDWLRALGNMLARAPQHDVEHVPLDAPVPPRRKEVPEVFGWDEARLAQHAKALSTDTPPPSPQWLELDMEALATLADCPRRYRLRYELGVPEPGVAEQAEEEQRLFLAAQGEVTRLPDEVSKRLKRDAMLRDIADTPLLPRRLDEPYVLEVPGAASVPSLRVSGHLPLLVDAPRGVTLVGAHRPGVGGVLWAEVEAQAAAELLGQRELAVHLRLSDAGVAAAPVHPAPGLGVRLSEVAAARFGAEPVPEVALPAKRCAQLQCGFRSECHRRL